MSCTPSSLGSWSLAAATALISTAGLLTAPIGNAAVDCPAGWEFGPSLNLKQSDGWTVTVATAGRSVGGPAAAIPTDRRPLWRGTGEGGSDGMTVAFGIGWDNGIVTHYTGVIDQTTGALTGERPDGVTWQGTASMRCVGAADAPPPA